VRVFFCGGKEEMEKENITIKAEYQDLLDRFHGGTVKPIEEYLNLQAVLLHYCSECDKEFYGKPAFILTKPNQRHRCHYPYGDNQGNRLLYVPKRGQSNSHLKSKKQRESTRKLTPYQVDQIITEGKKGTSMREIGQRLGVSNSTVYYHLKKHGLR
jgi:hypothetical protein